MIRKQLVVALIILVALAGGCSRSSPIKRSPETDALLRAAREGHGDTVRTLLASPDIDINATDERGSTALIEAARFGHDEVVRALLAHGADAKAKNKEGKTALMLAAQGGHDEVVQLLKQAGAME
jgi:uncharacterized protein